MESHTKMLFGAVAFIQDPPYSGHFHAAASALVTPRGPIPCRHEHTDERTEKHHPLGNVFNGVFRLRPLTPGTAHGVGPISFRWPVLLDFQYPAS